MIPEKVIISGMTFHITVNECDFILLSLLTAGA